MPRSGALLLAGLILAGCTLTAKPGPAKTPDPVVPPTESPAAEGTLTLSPTVKLHYTLWRAAEPGAPTGLTITDAAGAQLLQRTNVMELVGLRDVGAPTPVILVRVKSGLAIGDFYEAYLYDPTGLHRLTWERDPYIASLQDPEQGDRALITMTHEPVLGGGWQEVRRPWSYADGALQPRSQGPQVCDPSRYPGHPSFLSKALGGGEIRQGPFTFCLYFHSDTLMLGDRGESRAFYMTDLPGIAWTALWRYDGADTPGRTTSAWGALPEGLVGVSSYQLKLGQIGGRESGGVEISRYPLPDGRRQLGIWLQTPAGTYGARLVYRLVDGSVADVTVAPWDENAAWPGFATAVGQGGVTAVGLGDRLTLVDQAGRITRADPLGSAITTLVWSPTGRRLLIQTQDDRLWLLTPSGAAQPVETGIPPVPFLVAWSPDEQRLLLGENPAHMVTPSATDTVWLYSLADGTHRKLAAYENLRGLFWPDAGHALVQSHHNDERQPVTERYSIDPWQKTGQGYSWGVVAPDGKSMVYTSSQAGVTSLNLIDLVTSVIQTRWDGEPKGYSMDAAYVLDRTLFSPDSRRLAYTATRGQTEAAMLRITDVKGPDQLVTDRSAGTMAWAPGGGLLYAEQAGAGSVTVKLDNRSLGTVVGSELGVVVWTADGSRAALAIDDAGHARRLVIAQPEPSRLAEVPDSQGLTPLMWAGDQLLAIEDAYVHNYERTARVPRALWLINPATGQRTPILP